MLVKIDGIQIYYVCSIFLLFIMRILPFLTALLITSCLSAQDPIFSLVDQNQVYNNPAFTGTGNNFRAGISFRNQWPAISGSYVTTNLYADQYLGKAGGLGISFINDSGGRGTLINNLLQLSYSYGVKIGNLNKLYIGMALV